MPDKILSRRYLFIGTILSILPGLLLWILPKLARSSVETDMLSQAFGTYSGRNLGLEVCLWFLLIIGISLLIFSLKLRFPNPEHVQFEEEWEKKGR